MNLLSLLPWRKSAPRRARRAVDVVDERPCEEFDRPMGCGWFDSSHDLEHGLQVREHASADNLVRELASSAWLELTLQGRAPGPAA